MSTKRKLMNFVWALYAVPMALLLGLMVAIAAIAAQFVAPDDGPYA